MILHAPMSEYNRIYIESNLYGSIGHEDLRYATDRKEMIAKMLNCELT